MTDRGGIDRDVWAEVVTNLIATETAGNKTRFANLVGVNYKTVLRWLAGTVEVSEESIRQVAYAVHLNPLDLLVKVGLYEAADATPPPQTDDDPALAKILEADIPPRVKQQMIQRLHRLTQQEALRRLDEVQWWIDQAGA